MSIKKTTLSAGRPSARKAVMVMADDEPLVRINVELTVAARQKLKMHAIKSRKTISQLIRGFVDDLPD